MLSEDIENIDKVKRESGRRGVVEPRWRSRSAWPARYQACWARQCGQATVVETGARKTKPHEHA
jgi:hypothetical protein